MSKMSKVAFLPKIVYLGVCKSWKTHVFLPGGGIFLITPTWKGCFRGYFRGLIGNLTCKTSKNQSWICVWASELKNYKLQWNSVLKIESGKNTISYRKKYFDCVYLYYIIYILVYILVVASAGTRPPLSLTQGGGTNH